MTETQLASGRVMVELEGTSEVGKQLLYSGWPVTTFLLFCESGPGLEFGSDNGDLGVSHGKVSVQQSAHYQPNYPQFFLQETYMPIWRKGCIYTREVLPNYETVTGYDAIRADQMYATWEKAGIFWRVRVVEFNLRTL